MRFRDVSGIIQTIRAFLIGRKHLPHNRFPPLISPRSVPPPDIPRGDHKYSNQYYYNRSVSESIKPPVVAPVAEGPPVNQSPYKKIKAGGLKPDMVCFNTPPTPGPSWWWDGHMYYDCSYCPPKTCPSNDPPCSPKDSECKPERPEPSASKFNPPCPRAPDAGPRH